MPPSYGLDLSGGNVVEPTETASAKRNRRRRKRPSPAVSTVASSQKRLFGAPSSSGFSFGAQFDPSQPPPFSPFSAGYSAKETTAARKLANAQIDSLLAALPTQQS